MINNYYSTSQKKPKYEYRRTNMLEDAIRDAQRRYNSKLGEVKVDPEVTKKVVSVIAILIITFTVVNALTHRK